MKFITPDEITIRARITEEELKARLVHEALESAGALGPDGKPALGVKTRVVRGPSRVGGYEIEITTPARARLRLIAPGDAE